MLTAEIFLSSAVFPHHAYRTFFPLIYSITCDTAYFGGIATSTWICSGIRHPASISHSLHSTRRQIFLFQIHSDSLIEFFFPVLRYPYDVILAFPCRMDLNFYILTYFPPVCYFDRFTHCDYMSIFFTFPVLSNSARPLATAGRFPSIKK